MQARFFLVSSGIAVLSCFVLVGCGQQNSRSSNSTAARNASNSISSSVNSTKVGGLKNASNNANASSASGKKITSNSPSRTVLNSLQFLSSDHGWAVGFQDFKGSFRGLVWSTDNGGQIWTKTFLSDYIPEYIHMTNSKTGWLIGISSKSNRDSRIALLESQDGGRTWKKISFDWSSISGLKGMSHEQIKKIAGSSKIFFQDSKHGWLVAFDSLYTTSNSGHSWRRVNLPGKVISIAESNGQLLAIGPAEIWKLGTKGWSLALKLRTPLKSELYGTSVPPVYNLPFNRIAFATSKVGYALFTADESSMQGEEYIIYKTSNGGATWNPFVGSFIQPNKWNIPNVPSGNLLSFQVSSNENAYVGFAMPTEYPMLGYVNMDAKWHWISDGSHAPVSWGKGSLQTYLRVNSKTQIVELKKQSHDELLKTADAGSHWSNITPQ